VETVYAAAIAGTDDTELTAQRRAAEVYNAMLRGEASVSAGGASAPPLLYAEQLTVGGAMCTIDIPKIGVYLPVRHGTGAETLERAVGHVVGTSLPVGGARTHAVLSAHSGMASAKPVQSCFRTLTSLRRATLFTSMYWVRCWPTRWTRSPRYCLRTHRCCKSRTDRTW
jgi:sortase (surface protein transpeptidase)